MKQDVNAEALLQEARKRLAEAEDSLNTARTEEERFFLELEMEQCEQVVEDLENYAQFSRSHPTEIATAAA